MPAVSWGLNLDLPGSARLRPSPSSGSSRSRNSSTSLLEPIERKQARCYPIPPRARASISSRPWVCLTGASVAQLTTEEAMQCDGVYENERRSIGVFGTSEFGVDNLIATGELRGGPRALAPCAVCPAMRASRHGTTS